MKFFGPNYIAVTADTSGGYQVAAINSAMEYASRLGGGTVALGPGTYRFNDRIVGQNRTKLDLAPGAVLDFSAMTGWTNQTFDDALIKWQGTEGTPVALTANLKRQQKFQFRANSGTRSGTSVTFVLDMDATGVIAVGDLIWSDGSPAASGQAVYYTNNFTTGNTARVAPFPVTDVSGTSITVTIPADTGDASLDTGDAIPYIYRAADVAQVASTAGFAANDDLELRSDAYRTDGSTEKQYLGEHVVVARVLNSTMLLLRGGVQDDYLVSDNAQVVPVTLWEDCGIVGGGQIIGNGPNTGTGPGDKGVLFHRCRKPVLENVRITGCDHMGVYFLSCAGSRSTNNYIVFDALDEGGSASGARDVQYGVAVGGWTYGISEGDVVHGGRHAWVQTQTNSTSVHGITRNFTVVGMKAYGTWLGAYSTHQGADDLTFVGCHAIGCWGGMTLRYCRNVQVADPNIVDARSVGIEFYNHVEAFTIAGGFVSALQYPIKGGSDINVDGASPGGPVKIQGVQIEGGEQCVFIVDTESGTTASWIEVSGCTLKGSKYAGLQVQIGDTGQAADGFYGCFDNNTFIDCGQQGGQSTAYLINFRGGSANNCKVAGTQTLAHMFRITGAGTGDRLQFMGGSYLPGLLTDDVFLCDAGHWHKTDMPRASLSEDVTTVSGGLASPRFDRFGRGGMIMVDIESSGNLDGMLAGEIGQEVSFRLVAAARTVTVRDGQTVAAGSLNFQTAGGASRLLDGGRDTLKVQCDGVQWRELSFADNG